MYIERKRKFTIVEKLCIVFIAVTGTGIFTLLGIAAALSTIGYR